MRQALHIFRKDVRYLHKEILLSLSFALIFAAMGPGWVEMLMKLAAAYLIARVVHAEPIPGANQFWLTKPYHRHSLLGAKVLFILVFVNLPIALAQLAIVLSGGFPPSAFLAGFLSTQLLLTLLASLPIAALASITSGIMPFILSLFILAAVYFLSPGRLIYALYAAGSPWPTAVQWVRDSLAGAAIAGLTLAILYFQYRGRRTVRSRALAIAGTAACAAIYWTLPFPLAMAVQTGLSDPPAYSSALQAHLFTEATAPKSPPLGAYSLRGPGVVGLQFPITIQGLPDDITFRADSIPLTIEAPGGATWKPDRRRPANVNRQTTRSGAVTFYTDVTMDRAFFKQVGEMPVTLRASIYLVAFGNDRSQTIPLLEKPVNVLKRLQCQLGAFDVVNCRSAFGWPRALVYSSFGQNLDPLFQSISYSPFPGELRINPIAAHWSVSAPPRTTEVTIVMKEPIAHFRRDFEIPKVYLRDFAFAGVR